ncbi:MAG: GDP-L-fucose synthase family protein [Alphaproteobacteria bacterium]
MAEHWLKQDTPLQNKKIWIAGHNGMVGSALMRRLEGEGAQLLGVSRQELDLRHQTDVRDWVFAHKPDMIVLAAAKVGGIMANSENLATFFYDNMMISANVIHSAYEAGVGRLLFLGSSCIYPRECTQPIAEEALLGGALEPTNEAYALAKISGLKMAQYYRTQYGCDFISAMPCNLYGVGDSYDERHSHVIPALIMKVHKAKIEGAPSVHVWGSGRALREFLYVDDLADILVLLLQKYNSEHHINIGSGAEITIKELVRIICEVIGYKGEIVFDTKFPDGTPRKVLDTSRLLGVGWEPKMWLKDGIKKCHEDFLGRYQDEYSG